MAKAPVQLMVTECYKISEGNGFDRLYLMSQMWDCHGANGSGSSG